MKMQNNINALIEAYRSQLGNTNPSPYGNPLIINGRREAYNPNVSVGGGDSWQNQLGREQIYLPRTDAMQMGGIGSTDTRQGYKGTMNANMSDDDYAMLLNIINSLPMGDYSGI